MDFSPIENFRDSTGRTFMVAKLSPTLKTCRYMDRLYRVGFGEALPLLHADHIRIIENGVSYGVFNNLKEMIAFRSFLFDWRYSNPLDKPFFHAHEDYQGDEAVVPDCSDVGHRGVGHLRDPVLHRPPADWHRDFAHNRECMDCHRGTLCCVWGDLLCDPHTFLRRPRDDICRGSSLTAPSC